MPKFVANVDLSRNELQNAVLQALAGPPSSPRAGQIYFDTTLDRARVWDGDTWIDWSAVPTKEQLDALNIDAGTLGGEGGSFYLARGNHTGTQPLSTITGHDKAAHDGLGIDAATVGGQTVTQVRSGLVEDSDARLSDQRVPTDGSVTNAKVASNAAIELSKLAVDPLARGNHTGVQAIATVSGLQDALDDKQALAEKGAANGYASLDAQGKIPSAQLPAIAIGERFEVASEAAMLALDAQIGDVAVRTDDDSLWLLVGGDPSDIENWHPLTVPEGGIISVGGSPPITSTGGQTPTIGLAAGGIQTSHIGDGQVTPQKVSFPVLGKLVFQVGDGAATQYSLNHNLGTRDVQVQVRQGAAPFAVVEPDIEMTTENAVTLRFTEAPDTDEFRAVVIG